VAGAGYFSEQAVGEFGRVAVMHGNAVTRRRELGRDGPADPP
jgi:hypothetical protein